MMDPLQVSDLTELREIHNQQVNLLTEWNLLCPQQARQLRRMLNGSSPAEMWQASNLMQLLGAQTANSLPL